MHLRLSEKTASHDREMKNCKSEMEASVASYKMTEVKSKRWVRM